MVKKFAWLDDMLTDTSICPGSCSHGSWLLGHLPRAPRPLNLEQPCTLPGLFSYPQCLLPGIQGNDVGFALLLLCLSPHSRTLAYVY